MQRKKQKKRKEATNSPTTPPLETLASLLARLGLPLQDVNFGLHMKPEVALAEFATANPFELSAVAVGSPNDLAISYCSASTVRGTIVELAQHAAGRGEAPAERANAAGVNLCIACETILSAILLHLQSPKTACLGAITLARSALESAGIACWIASRRGSEVHQWEHNDMKSVQKKELMSVLDGMLAGARDYVPCSQAAYEWMCGYAHLEHKALALHYERTTEQLHEHSYAAIAYSCLVTALVGELLIGHEGLAIWPQSWPGDLIWGFESVAQPRAPQPRAICLPAAR